MSDVYLLDELLSALGSPDRAEHISRFRSLGVPPAAVDMCGTARIQPEGDLYWPDDDGPEAWIVPCIEDGETIDLLAFAPDTPERWWLRLSQAAYLGADALVDTMIDESVRVFRTPLSWLRAGAPADGLVVVDDDIARRELAYHSVDAEDLAHGLELDRLLTIPAQRPQIRVPAGKAP